MKTTTTKKYCLTQAIEECLKALKENYSVHLTIKFENTVRKINIGYRANAGIIKICSNQTGYFYIHEFYTPSLVYEDADEWVLALCKNELFTKENKFWIEQVIEEEE